MTTLALERYEALMDVVRSDAEVDDWVRTQRHEAMRRDESTTD
jgi:hypothetical protein